MVSRQESAAVTRRDLLAAAGALLDEGGPEAVTLREVGARAGVSRSAPYRHFADKAQLLAAVASEAWQEIGRALEHLAASGRDAPNALRGALVTFVDLGCTRPYRYRLMFSTPDADPTAVVRAAGQTHDQFLALVAGVVGPTDAPRYGALLLSTAHGVAGLTASGHLTAEKWQTDPHEVIALLTDLLPAGTEPTPPTGAAVS